MTSERMAWTIISPGGVTFTADNVTISRDISEIVDPDDPDMIRRICGGPLQIAATLRRVVEDH